MSERLQKVEGKISGSSYFRVEPIKVIPPKLLSFSRTHAFYLRESKALSNERVKKSKPFSSVHPDILDQPVAACPVFEGDHVSPPDSTSLR